MNKKTIILTEKQLDEIANGCSNYLDALGTTPDMPEDFASETSAQGSAGEGESYAEPEQTDDFRKMQTRNSWPMGMRTFGKNAVNIREMSKKDWEERYILCEENSRLANRVFDDKSYEAAKKEGQRIRKNVNQMRNGKSSEEKIKAQQTLSRMMKNGGENFGKSSSLLAKAQNADKIIQANKPEGSKIKSAPKTGVGTSHDKKFQNGIITPTE